MSNKNTRVDWEQAMEDNLNKLHQQGGITILNSQGVAVGNSNAIKLQSTETKKESLSESEKKQLLQELDKLLFILQPKAKSSVHFDDLQIIVKAKEHLTYSTLAAVREQTSPWVRESSQELACKVLW